MTEPHPNTITVCGLEFTLDASTATDNRAHYRHEHWLSLYRHSGALPGGLATWWTATLHDIDTDADCPDRRLIDLIGRHTADAESAILALAEVARAASAAAAWLLNRLEPQPEPAPEPECIDPTAPHYAWLPGMRTTCGARILKATAETILVWQDGGVAIHQTSTFEGKPDLSDPATSGCVNRLVGEAILAQAGTRRYNAAKGGILDGTVGPAPRPATKDCDTHTKDPVPTAHPHYRLEWWSKRQQVWEPQDWAAGQNFHDVAARAAEAVAKRPLSQSRVHDPDNWRVVEVTSGTVTPGSAFLPQPAKP